MDINAYPFRHLTSRSMECQYYRQHGPLLHDGLRPRLPPVQLADDVALHDGLVHDALDAGRKHPPVPHRVAAAREVDDVAGVGMAADVRHDAHVHREQTAGHRRLELGLQHRRHHTAPLVALSVPTDKHKLPLEGALRKRMGLFRLRERLALERVVHRLVL